MFASYEIGTSCPSLTAIKRYDLDKSADVLLMDHLKKLIKGFYKTPDCQKKGSSGPIKGTVCRVVPLPLWISKITELEK